MLGTPGRHANSGVAAEATPLPQQPRALTLARTQSEMQDPRGSAIPFVRCLETRKMTCYPGVCRCGKMINPHKGMVQD